MPTSNKINFLELRSFDEFKSYIHSGTLENLSTDISNTFNGISKSFINAIIQKFNIRELNTSNIEIIFNYLCKVIDCTQTYQLSFEPVKNSEGNIKDYFLVPSEDISSNFDLNFFIYNFYFIKEPNENFKNTEFMENL